MQEDESGPAGGGQQDQSLLKAACVCSSCVLDKVFGFHRLCERGSVHPPARPLPLFYGQTPPRRCLQQISLWYLISVCPGLRVEEQV